MGKSSIEWTEVVWNPVRGCLEVSPGCGLCYARTMAARFSDPGSWGHGFAERTGNGGHRWTGKVELIPGKLAEPLSWSKPRMCFVNSTSDLFHEELPFEHIAAVYGVMMASQLGTFQILTKRPERRRAFHEWLRAEGDPQEVCEEAALEILADPTICHLQAGQHGWPLPNVWEGVSVESQEYADKRIPELLATPAALRFLSIEPLLGPVDLDPPRCECHGGDYISEQPGCQPWCYECDTEACFGNWIGNEGGIDWVIVGGESGHGARPVDLAWVRAIVAQCRESEVPCFVKQLGQFPYETVECFEQLGTEGALANLATLHNRPVPRGWTQVHTPDGKSRLYRHHELRDRKGGRMDEWPDDLRGVRETPAIHGTRGGVDA